MKRPSQRLADTLKRNGFTIAFAESMTCGLASHGLGTVSGTSDFFLGSIVCYEEEVKTGLLNVKPSLLRKYTAESQQVTDALAKNLKSLMHADVCAAITGLAAPGASEKESKPVGTVFCSMWFRGKFYRVKKQFRGSPLIIKSKACDLLYSFIAARIR
jgi:nicotinamide-nucleotide amidase